MACGNAYVEHFAKFLDFLKHNDGSSEHYKISLYLMHNVQLVRLRAPTVLRGVVALGYGVNNKVPKLNAWEGGIFKLGVAKWEIA